MKRGWFVVVAVALGALVAAALAVVGSARPLPALVLVGTGIVVGEFFELRPADRASLPISFAVFTVLVGMATPAEVIVVVVVGEALAGLIRSGPALRRLTTFFERSVEASAAGLSFTILDGLPGAAHGARHVLVALTGSAIAPIVFADVVGRIRGVRIPALRARGADLAVVTSGVLMAIGYSGIDGKGGLGLWGPLLFSIPLVAACYSFELLRSTRKSFEQTIGALSAAPELGGLVRPGHADRVAATAAEMGSFLGLHADAIDEIRSAALLHHLGAVCLDEPHEGEVLDPVAVSASSADMLRGSDALAASSEIIAAEPLHHRPQGNGRTSGASLGGMVLKVASAYDELTDGSDEHASWAVEALYTGPGYVYDGRVLGALERVLERRGALPGR